MPTPDFRSVYEDPHEHRAAICNTDDNKFEGQNFDRTQVFQPSSTGTVQKKDFSNLTQKVERTMSSFTNATGGLLVVGVSKHGVVQGIDHLTEDQKTALLDLSSLYTHGVSIHRKIHSIKVDGDTKQITLFMVDLSEAADRSRVYCHRKSDGKFWIRRGLRTDELKGIELDQFKRDRKIVDFEGMPAGSFNAADADTAVIDEYRTSTGYQESRTTAELLYDAGAINGKIGAQEWLYAGLLFFSSNPRRVISCGYIRLLRFDCSFDDEKERPTPTFDRDFDGPLTKQIRDFRTFATETGFFKTYEIRLPAGGFTSEPEYPSIAIDEAVVNAVAHRDYASTHPIICEKYTDAFVVTNPGQLLQGGNVPERFDLGEMQLKSTLRNPKLMGWLRSMKDAHGAAYVKALSEGTRQMRDEMTKIGLPPPVYESHPLETRVILRNNAKQRAAILTGGIGTKMMSNEFTNLYPLQGLQESEKRSENQEKRRVFLSVVCDKFVSKGWIIDKFSKGRVIVHPKGDHERTPDALRKIVRLIPAYELAIRSFYDRIYLSIDFTLQIRSVLTAQRAAAQFGHNEINGLNAFAIIDGKVERGRVLSMTRDYAKVYLFDSNEEVMLPVNQLYPNLRRDQLNVLVHKAAPSYNFTRAIKTFSLSIAKNAAHERARRIAKAVETFKKEIFPIEFDALMVNISDQPLLLHEKGDGKWALPASTIQEPNVEFSHKQSTANIRSGITKFGAYQHDARDIRLIAIVEPGFESKMRDLVQRLQHGAYIYKGFERTFSIRLKLDLVSSANDLRVDEECRRLIEANSEWEGNQDLDRILLVHTPESEFALDDVSSPYYRAKRILLEGGIPSQMIDSPTLHNPDYKDLNLALNIAAKTGNTPWVLPESIPDADFFVGLSYTSNRDTPMEERVIGFANVFNKYGRWEFYSGGNEAVPYSNREKHYEQLVAKTMKQLNLNQSPIVYFHYSAKFSHLDRSAILRGARTIRPHGTYVFVWINTHHPVRLFNERAEADGSVARGRFIVGSNNQIFLSTTGYNQYRKAMGTPQALEINTYIEHNTTNSQSVIDNRSIARQILCLTKLNWASTDAICGEPITTKYAKDIAYLTAAFQRQKQGRFVLHSALERTPWFI